MMNVMKVVSNAMDELGINYAFITYTDEIEYPYFTGEYNESESMTEDGLKESTFTLNGFTRGTWIELEIARQKIENKFHRVEGLKTITDDGSAVVIFYAGSFAVPIEDMELKRIQINLKIKEWKVN